MKSSLPLPQLLIMSPMLVKLQLSVQNMLQPQFVNIQNLLARSITSSSRILTKNTCLSSTYMFELNYKDFKHFVNIDSNRFFCSFSKTLGLPCQHAFAVQRKLQFMSLCDRWLKLYQIQVPGSKDHLESALPDDVSSVPQSDQFRLNISKVQQKPLKATLSQTKSI